MIPSPRIDRQSVFSREKAGTARVAALIEKIHCPLSKYDAEVAVA